MENVSVPRPPAGAHDAALQAVYLRLEAAFMTLGFAAPCVSVTLHDNEDIDPLVGKAGPVYVVAACGAAPADAVKAAVAGSETEEK